MGLLCTALYASIDSDMDGVPNNRDKCPNTPFSDLVNANGCAIKSLVSNNHFDIILGASYADTNYVTLNKSTTIASSLAVDYFYKNFSIQASTAYYVDQSKSSIFPTVKTSTGLYDTYVGASYMFKPLKNLSLRLGAGALLPTYQTNLNNNKTDYKTSLNAGYYINNLNLFATYAYTIINDKDIVNIVSYQNTNAFSAGLGYQLRQDFYLSTSYYSSQSIYKGYKDIQTASLYGSYSINNNRWISLSYAYGLTNTSSKNYLALYLGFYF